MILVDASVLIDYLRTKDAKLDRIFRNEPVAVCGITRSEILAGARGANDRQRLLLFLARFHQILTSESSWDIAGDNLAALNASGLNVPVPDVVVVTIGIENNLEVWARDAHFRKMQTILPALKLFQEPP